MHEAKRVKQRLAVSDRGMDGWEEARISRVVLVLAKFTRTESEQRIFCLAQFQSVSTPRARSSCSSCCGVWKMIPAIPRCCALWE